MATIKTIGTASRDYSTIGAFVTAAAAATWSGGWEGSCYPDTEFTEQVNIAANSAVNYGKLYPATGQSAFDTSTNPLKYDATKGVGVKNTTAYTQVLTIGKFVTVERMQFRQTTNQLPLNIAFGTDSPVINRCLFQHEPPSSATNSPAVIGGSSGLKQTFTNNVYIAFYGSALALQYSSSIVFANNTIVSPSDLSNTHAALTIDHSPALTNNAILGFSAFFSGSGTPSGSNNATDKSSVGFGTSNVTSLTFASQFNGVTSTAMDFTLKTGNSIGASTGATDTTDIPAAIDIFGTARTSGQWSIGAHQPASGGPTVYNVNVVAISNSVALIGKSVGLKRAASSNAVALNIKSVGLPRLAISNSIALQSHSFIKTISAVAISNSIALISKAVSKSLIAASNSVALISSIKAKLVNVVASSNSVALSKRDVGKSLLATSNAVALIQKTVSKPLLAVSNAIALCAKATSKSLLAISNSVGLNSFIKAKLINVVATSNSVALASRGVGKNLIISSNSAAQISKSISLNRIASSNSIGLIRKSISLSRLAISASIAYCAKTIPLRLIAVSNAIALAVVALANAVYIEWPERLFKPKKRDRSIKPKKRRLVLLMSFVSSTAETDAATLLEKMVTEVAPVQFDFEDLFDDGVTVTITIVITEVLTGTDVTTSMKQGNPGLKAGTQRTYSQLVKAGTAGNSYYIAAHAIGSDTSEQDLVFILPVVDLRLG